MVLVAGGGNGGVLGRGSGGRWDGEGKTVSREELEMAYYYGGVI